MCWYQTHSLFKIKKKKIETESHLSKAGLGLVLQLRMTLNFWSFCLPNAAITVVSHWVKFMWHQGKHSVHFQLHGGVQCCLDISHWVGIGYSKTFTVLMRCSYKQRRCLTIVPFVWQPNGQRGRICKGWACWVGWTHAARSAGYFEGVWPAI